MRGDSYLFLICGRKYVTALRRWYQSRGGTKLRCLYKFACPLECPQIPNRNAHRSRCATQNCRSATSGKAVDVGSVASSAKREQIAVQEIAPVGVVDLSIQEHVVITAQSPLSHIERPLVAVKEKGVRAQFASIENHFFDGNLQKKQTKNIVTHLYNPT